MRLSGSAGTPECGVSLAPSGLAARAGEAPRTFGNAAEYKLPREDSPDLGPRRVGGVAQAKRRPARFGGKRFGEGVHPFAAPVVQVDDISAGAQAQKVAARTENLVGVEDIPEALRDLWT